MLTFPRLFVSMVGRVGGQGRRQPAVRPSGRSQARTRHAPRLFRPPRSPGVATTIKTLQPRMSFWEGQDIVQ